MTREEAIKIIDCYDIGFYDLSGAKIPADKLADAFDMAIEALSADTVSREHHDMEVKELKHQLFRIRIGRSLFHGNRSTTNRASKAWEMGT